MKRWAELQRVVHEKKVDAISNTDSQGRYLFYIEQGQKKLNRLEFEDCKVQSWDIGTSGYTVNSGGRFGINID